MEPITVKATVVAPRERVWECYTSPAHIMGWNFADPSWHCPRATNDLRVGGTYVARMEARDGSAGFDFEATYTEVVLPLKLVYTFGDRRAAITFEEVAGGTEVVIVFDPEMENSIEMQRQGWQSILNNFKTYVETR